MLFCVSATTACYPDNPVSVFFQPQMKPPGRIAATRFQLTLVFFQIRAIHIPAELMLLVFLLVLPAGLPYFPGTVFVQAAILFPPNFKRVHH
jgi:hypothetical protein